jgi:hypothetical protein
MQHSRRQTADANLILDFFENTQMWHVVRWVATDPARPGVGRWDTLYRSGDYFEARSAFDHALAQRGEEGAA